jgi:hypothetical protein
MAILTAAGSLKLSVETDGHDKARSPESTSRDAAPKNANGRRRSEWRLAAAEAITEIGECRQIYELFKNRADNSPADVTPK